MGLISWLTEKLFEKGLRFADAELEEAVREAIGKPVERDPHDPNKIASPPLSAADVSVITNFNAGNRKIRYLEGIEQLENLRTLDLSDNLISDVSSLAGIHSLEKLNLANNPVADASPLDGLRNLKTLILLGTPALSQEGTQPAVKGEPADEVVLLEVEDEPQTSLHVMEKAYFEDPRLEAAMRDILGDEGDIPDGPLLPEYFSEITELELEDNRIESLKGLEAFAWLTSLNLAENNISDLSHLAGLRELKMLDLSVNRITDLGPLGSLDSLEELDLSENPIKKIVALKGLLRLRVLDIYATKVKDIWPLRGLTALSSLDMRACHIKDIRVLEHLTGLTDLDIGRMDLEDISVLRHLGNLETLWMLDNKVNDISALHGLKQLQDIDLEDNCITDFSPVGHVRKVDGMDKQFKDCGGKTAARGGTVTFGKEEIRLKEGEIVVVDSEGVRIERKGYQ